MKKKIDVGVAGFEPATSASQTRRDNRATLHPENEVCKFIKENSSKAMVSIKNINQNMNYHYLLYRIFIYLDIKLIIL